MFNVKIPSNNKTEYLLNILKVVTSLFPPDKKPTDSELEMLSMFLALPDSEFHYNRFGKKARQRVAASFLDTKTATVGVANRLQSLVAKGLLRRDEDRIIYASPLVKQIMESYPSYSVAFIFNENSKSKGIDS